MMRIHLYLQSTYIPTLNSTLYRRADIYTKYTIFLEMAFESDAENLLTDMFQDPVGYFPPEPSATYVEHTLLCGQIIQLRLVGHNPLWVPTYCKPLPPRTFRSDPMLMLFRDTTYGMAAKSFQNTSSNTSKLQSATNMCLSLELGPGCPALLLPFLEPGRSLLQITQMRT